MAEVVRFELTRPFGLLGFKASVLDHSTKLPELACQKRLELLTCGLEGRCSILLSYWQKLVWCPEPDLNRYADFSATDFNSVVSANFTIRAPILLSERCTKYIIEFPARNNPD